MKKNIYLLLISSLAPACLLAQLFYFPRVTVTDSTELSKAMPVLARQVMSPYTTADKKKYFNDLLRLQLVACEYKKANSTIDSLRSVAQQERAPFASLQYLQYELFAKAKLQQPGNQPSFATAFKALFTATFDKLDNKSALYSGTGFVSLNGVNDLQDKLQQQLLKLKAKDSISIDEAIDLCKQFLLWDVFRNIEPTARLLLQEDNNRRYLIDEKVLITTKEGATINAVVVRQRSVTVPQPTAFAFTIYAEESNLVRAMWAAAYGYAGVVALTRGKGLSPDAVAPYEHEATDVNAVIGWIIKQPWSNGKVGMYGGSYDGFSQWAAAKHLHPALKTIVPYVAAIPGQGVPMENNVFINANYGWAFYTTNNKYLDNKTYYDPQRWNAMQNKWYAAGSAYRSIDSIDGTPNKWLQRWSQHPAFDKYWQDMIPYREDFAQINIPVLSITGYYDDGQISALHYLKEHYKYNKQANHYLIIGPYDHLGAQRGGVPVLRGYTVDPVALINTRDITFEWLDYILKDAAKPAILKDKINYEIMGANRWGHAPSPDSLHSNFLTLYLSNAKLNNQYQLTDKKPAVQQFLSQQVDFKDRTTSNNDYYPYPIIRKELDTSNGLFFVSQPFDEPVIMDGSFSGVLKASINKKDMDIGVVLYELLPNGEYFHLSYFLGRASYAEDMSKRKLLTPGKIEIIPFERTRMAGRQIGKGSRLLVVLNINKNPFAQINYGTGKDVSDETIDDAKIPLQIKWYNDSYIRIPVAK